MTEDEAREAAMAAAWKSLSAKHPLGTVIPAADGFDAGWDAARQYDAQRIAALVAALNVAGDHVCCECVLNAGGGGGGGEWTYCVPHAVIRRALAGQTEEVTND